MTEQVGEGCVEFGREWVLPDEAATCQLGERVARALEDGLVIYLEGPLGAGKTSFARALLTASGVGERVKSPTYSLVESYPVGNRTAWHLDLYRIVDPGELEWLGLDALSAPSALVLIEWSERGAGALPAADVELRLAYTEPESGRKASLRAFTARGGRMLSRLA